MEILGKEVGGLRMEADRGDACFRGGEDGGVAGRFSDCGDGPGGQYGRCLLGMGFELREALRLNEGGGGVERRREV